MDYANGILSFDQSKTVGHSSASRVSIPLRPDLFRLIGTAKEYGKAKSDRIFNLPSHTMCLKALSRWTTRAGIEKHITWHCGRHSFATNLRNAGVEMEYISESMGHSSGSHAITQIYLDNYPLEKQMEYNSKLLNVETEFSKREKLLSELSELSEADIVRLLENIKKSNQ